MIATASACPVPLDELEASAKDFSEAVVLPAACYTDQDFFKFEMDAIFAKEWVCLGPSTVELPLFGQLLEAAIGGVALFNNQDLPTNTAIQKGLGSRWAPRGPYSWQEEILSQFNRWLVRRYGSTPTRCV